VNPFEEARGKLREWALLSLYIMLYLNAGAALPLRYLFSGRIYVLKAILFDMDGVLIDTERIYIMLQKQMGEAMGVTFTSDDLKIYMGVATDAMWADLKEKFDLPRDAAELAREETGLMDEHYARGEILPFEESISLMKECAANGLKVAVATSSSEDNASNVIRRLAIGEYIGAVSTLCRAGKSKPAPDIFLLAAKMLGVRPSECVVIEDSQSGVQAAKNAGMAAVGLAHEAYGVDLSEADVVVKSCGALSIEKLREIAGE